MYDQPLLDCRIAFSGGVVKEGRYRFSVNDIILYDSTESRYPDLSRSDQTPAYRNKATEDEQYTFEVLDTNTISIVGHSFYRVSPA